MRQALSGQQLLAESHWQSGYWLATLLILFSGALARIPPLSLFLDNTCRWPWRERRSTTTSRKGAAVYAGDTTGGVGGLTDQAVLIDTRSEDQRLRQGLVPGAISHPLSVILWRLDPDCPTTNDKIPLDAEVILICREGYSSTFAALQLGEIGFENVADVIGGVDAWKAAGLPLVLAAPLADGQPNSSTAQLDEPVTREGGDDLAVERAARERGRSATRRRVSARRWRNDPS